MLGKLVLNLFLDSPPNSGSNLSVDRFDEAKTRKTFVYDSVSASTAKVSSSYSCWRRSGAATCMTCKS
eukprot:CAMPEP_0206519570 /NCGR_PEP_ID=MMETSP0324_2-20121206/65277_1 /ASSEMBLY_ACC=CAM_ASM_000836 /TAXON_ID=2866 /ORGANISM="Crypthecodinium cohnii, Strain Seligo" /LENGTH=67 /DNA_ID=CAMNT_0054013191 /DNA_START=63 /DNA_END=263 /DNA_ORIENTATION=-